MKKHIVIFCIITLSLIAAPLAFSETSHTAATHQADENHPNSSANKRYLKNNLKKAKEHLSRAKANLAKTKAMQVRKDKNLSKAQLQKEQASLEKANAAVEQAEQQVKAAAAAMSQKVKSNSISNHPAMKKK